MSQPDDFVTFLQSTKPVPQFLYHYTNASAFLGIIDSGKLWATDQRFVNDGLDFQFGLDLIENLLENPSLLGIPVDARLQDTARNLMSQATGYRMYAACFCEGGDLLSQWRAYAVRGGGLSVGFVTLHLQQTTGLKLLPCVYTHAAQVHVIAQWLTLVQSSFGGPPPAPLPPGAVVGLFEALAYLLCLLKDPAFQQEKEWRLPMRDPTGGPFVGELFRAAGGEVVPYVELEMRGANGRIPFIEEIFVYGKLAKLSAGAIDDLLLVRSIGNHGVLNSRVPFREWWMTP